LSENLGKVSLEARNVVKSLSSGEGDEDRIRY